MGLAGVRSAIQRGRTLVPLKYRKKTFVFCIVLLSMIFDDLNVTGAITTSFSMSERLKADPTTISWAVSAYSLTLGSFIVFFGKLGDIIGVHNVFMVGAAAMAVFSLITAVIDKSAIALIVFRAFQGISAAALMPSGFALAAHYFHGPALQNAIRALTIVLNGSFGLGTLLGGAFSATKLGYKGFFFFTFSVSSLCSVLLFLFINPIEPTEEQKQLKLKNLDYAGVAMLVVGLLLIIFGLTQGGVNWNSPKVYVTIPIGFLLLVAMFLFEDFYLKSYKQKFTEKIAHDTEADTGDNTIKKDKKNSEPGFEYKNFAIEKGKKSDWRISMDLLFPGEVFKITNFFPLFIGAFFAYFTCIAVLSTFIHYHIYIDYDTPLLASLKVLPFSVGLVFASLIYSEKLVKKTGIRNFIIAVCVIQPCCAVWMSFADYKIKNSYWKFEFASQFIMAISLNFFFMAYLNAIMYNTPLHLQGVVSGIFQTGGQVGVAICSAIVSSILGDVEFEKGDSEFREKQFKHFQKTFYVTIAGAAVFFLSMFFVKNPKPLKEHDEDDEQYAPFETSSG